MRKNVCRVSTNRWRLSFNEIARSNYCSGYRLVISLIKKKKIMNVYLIVSCGFWSTLVHPLETILFCEWKDCSYHREFLSTVLMFPVFRIYAYNSYLNKYNIFCLLLYIIIIVYVYNITLWINFNETVIIKQIGFFNV